MAFFTFTTVSGSAATNDLKYTVAAAIDGAVTLSLSSTGTLVYTNVQGNSTDSGWTLANLAAKGMPVATTTFGNDPITVSLTTFQTPTLVAKAASNITSIDATGATATQINNFIANNTGAAAGSLINASLTSAQFSSLKDLALLAANGAVAIDATAANDAQKAALANGQALIKDGAIDNASLLYGQFGAGAGQIAPAKFAAGGVALDAAFVAAANANAMIAYINTNIAKVASVDNVSIVGATDLVNPAFTTFSTVLAPQGILSVDATNMTAADYTTLIANRTLFAPASITAANTVSVADFVEIPNKFINGGVAAGSLDFTGASDAEIASVITNKAKLANGAIINADITPNQFTGLTTKIADGQATVDAANAAAADVTAIVSNLVKFGTATLTNLTVNQTQFATAMADLVNFNDAVADGEVAVVATSASVINATGFTRTLDILGSDGADNITTGNAATTVQSGKGLDIIVGGNGDDELRGGNAADTIDGGAGADNIFGGKSLVAQSLTGGTGIDTFNLSEASVNAINDLGVAGDQDIVKNAAGAVTTAKVVADWTATVATYNSGTMTLTSDAAGVDINVALATGSVGYTLNGSTGGEVLAGSSFADTINGLAGTDTLIGNAGNDVLTGGAANDTMTGGAGADTFNVDAATDTITDLVSGDALVVSSGATAVANSVSAFLATSATSNNGTVTINSLEAAANAGTYINLAEATGPNGFTVVTSEDKNVFIGSAQDDTFVLDANLDLAGSTFNGGAGANTFEQVAAGSLDFSAAGITMSNITTLALVDDIGNTLAYTIDQGFSSGRALTVTGDLATDNDTFTIIKDATAFDAAAVASAALVVTAGDWYLSNAGAADVLTYWDQVAGNAVSITLTGSGNGAATGITGDLVYTAG